MSGSVDKTVKVWDVNSGLCVFSGPHLTKQWLEHVKTKLEEIVRETIRRKSHINENVVKKNCAALKEKFKDFASLYQRPSKDTFPWTFVEPQDALGSLKSCSKNMAERTIDEQNA